MFITGTKSFFRILILTVGVSFLKINISPVHPVQIRAYLGGGATFLARMSTISMQIFNEKEFSDLFLTYHRRVSRAAP